MKKIIYEKSIQFLYPELAKQWHPTKNSKTPDEISPGSNYRAWWLYPYDDSKTGKHFDFEWQTTVTNRIKSPGCPFLSGRAVWAGFNDLKTCYPDLAKEWHPTKNLIQAHMVTWCSGQKVWWLYPYDDPVTGKHYDFEWEATIANRIYSPKCPFLTGRAIWPGFNDLATLYPFLVKEWHPTKNGSQTPHHVSAFSHQKVWWLLPYDDPKTGKHFDFEWEASVANRTRGKQACPYLSGQKIYSGFNDFASIYPDLVQQWDVKKNLPLTPTSIGFGSGKKVWWKCPHCNHEWQTAIYSRKNNRRCPSCKQ